MTQSGIRLGDLWWPSLVLPLWRDANYSVLFSAPAGCNFGQIFQFGLNTAPVLLLRFREELLRILSVFFDGVHLLPLHIWSLFGNAKSKAL